MNIQNVSFCFGTNCSNGVQALSGLSLSQKLVICTLQSRSTPLYVTLCACFSLCECLGFVYLTLACFLLLIVFSTEITDRRLLVHQAWRRCAIIRIRKSCIRSLTDEMGHVLQNTTHSGSFPLSMRLRPTGTRCGTGATGRRRR